MSILVKRKRGRPRLDEPSEVNDFDFNLIREFQVRPVLYDRNHPQYRNKDFLEPQWAEIASLLGLNVTIIKNRMLQLRNRYNLERRRIEALQEQYNDDTITSQWTLYRSLEFLSEHIRTRRSYLTRNTTSPVNSSDENDGTAAKSNYNSTDTNREMNPRNVVHRSQINNGIGGIIHKKNCNSVNNVASNSCDKFRAFGQFLTSSLIEMNELDALRLVEKFTSELVKSLRAEQVLSTQQ